MVDGGSRIRQWERQRGRRSGGLLSHWEELDGGGGTEYGSGSASVVAARGITTLRGTGRGVPNTAVGAPAWSPLGRVYYHTERNWMGGGGTEYGSGSASVVAARDIITLRGTGWGGPEYGSGSASVVAARTGYYHTKRNWMGGGGFPKTAFNKMIGSYSWFGKWNITFCLNKFWLFCLIRYSIACIIRYSLQNKAPIRYSIKYMALIRYSVNPYPPPP